MNKNGLMIFHANEVLDKVTMSKSELKLIGSGDGVEVMIQDVEADIMFDIYPSEDNPSLMEFFYILEGEVQYITDKDEAPIILSVGDYFYTKNLKDPCIFKPLVNSKLMYVSSQPIFHFIGESLLELRKINQEVDKKDKYTHAHSERVQNLSTKIGLEMNFNRDKLVALAVAALFHDLGKIFVDDEILLKDDKLSYDEYELVKMHPENSAKYVQSIKFLDVSPIVLQHHERIDGSGYPLGLKGDEICIEAKIIAVADSFDAMTTDRPYRKAITAQEAVNEIVRLKGTWYDKDVVDAFINSLQKDGII